MNGKTVFGVILIVLLIVGGVIFYFARKKPAVPQAQLPSGNGAALIGGATSVITSWFGSKTKAA
jgi:hypothetical protein